MKNLKKKGFTIVELVIVIAVIAILSAVLIPTFSNLIRKANISADTQLVKHLNTSIAMDKITGGNHETMYDALECVKNDGFDVAKINATARYNEILWDSKNDCFAYYNKDADKIEYIPEFEGEAPTASEKYLYWVIDNEVHAEYSTYLVEYQGAVTTSKGIDTTECDGITTIKYENTGNEQNVVIRTNNQFTDVEVNAPNDNVVHYGVGKNLLVTSVSLTSFHVKGSWQKITLESGNLVLEDSSFVGEVVKNGGKIINNGVIAKPISGASAETDVTGNGINGIETNDVIKVGNAEAFMNLAVSQSTGVFGTSSLNIELTSDIDLTGKTWVPFGAELEDGTGVPFSGIIDGKGFKVIGLNNGDYKGKIDKNQNTSTVGENYGFIATVTGNVEVKNISFTDADIINENARTLGVVIADTNLATSVILYKVNVSGVVKGLDKVAGLIGYAKYSNVSIQQCNVDAELYASQTEGNNRVGGLIGYIGNGGIVSVYDCNVTGTISGDHDSMYGAICAGLTSDNANGLKVENFSSSVTINKLSTGNKTTSDTEGMSLIGVNSLHGENSVVNSMDGFTFQRDERNYIEKIK